MRKDVIKGWYLQNVSDLILTLDNVTLSKAELL